LEKAFGCKAFHDLPRRFFEPGVRMNNGQRGKISTCWLAIVMAAFSLFAAALPFTPKAMESKTAGVGFKIWA
jgi:hypothetical protein